MKAIKLTPKEKELFEALKSNPGGGIAPACQDIKHCLLQTSGQGFKPAV